MDSNIIIDKYIIRSYYNLNQPEPPTRPDTVDASLSYSAPIIAPCAMRPFEVYEKIYQNVSWGSHD